MVIDLSSLTAEELAQRFGAVFAQPRRASL